MEQQAIVQWIRNYFISQPPVLKFKSLIINNDHIIYEWEQPVQHQLAFMNISVPYIQEYRIDYKKSDYHISWNHTICTNSSSLKRIIFHLIKYNENGDVITIKNSYNDGDTRHEYGVFKNKKDIFDIRIYAVNYAKPVYNFLTHIRLSFYNTNNIKTISNYCSIPPTLNFHNKFYLIGENKIKNSWYGMENYITTSFMNGWVFIQPHENIIIDNYVYKNGKWEDKKLKETIDILIKNAKSNDIIFTILRYDFINRIMGDNINEKEINLKNILKDYPY